MSSLGGDPGLVSTGLESAGGAGAGVEVTTVRHFTKTASLKLDSNSDVRCNCDHVQYPAAARTATRSARPGDVLSTA